MDFINSIDTTNFPITPETARTYFNVAVTILISVILDNIFRSFIKVPKHFDNKRARMYVTIFRSVITFIVYAIAVNIVLVLLGINITPLLTSVGVIGVILGIGARQIIEDLLTGLFLLSQRTISIGDYVKIDDSEGTIESLSFRTLTIRTGNGALQIIPNGQVKRVTNFSRHRATVTINLPVKSDQQIEKVLEHAETALSLVKKEKEFETVVFSGSKVNGIDEFKDAGIMIVQVTLITSPAMRWEIGRKYRYLIKKEFEKNKILFG
jgi:small conductance mechanosensitive channel